MTDPKTIPYFEDSIRVDDVTGFPTLTFDGERYGLPTFTARLTPEAARMLGRLLTAVCDAMEVADPGVAEPVLSADPAWPPSPFDVDTPGPIHDDTTAVAILRARTGWRPRDLAAEHEACMADLRAGAHISGMGDLMVVAEVVKAVSVEVQCLIGGPVRLHMEAGDGRAVPVVEAADLATAAAELREWASHEQARGPR